MTTLSIELPFPPASLSGHNKGHWRGKSDVVADHRYWAKMAARGLTVPDEGDIALRVDFYPPDRRGDRINFPNRMKPYFDGLADALGVNDKRFDIPTYRAHPPQKPGRVVISIPTGDGQRPPLDAASEGEDGIARRDKTLPASPTQTGGDA